MAIRLGWFTNNVGLHILHRTEILQNNLKAAGYNPEVEWLHVEPGNLSPDFIAANLIDLGGTGSTPPIAAQSRGIPLYYVAHSVPRDLGGIVVRKSDDIHTIADLKGKKISIAIGAWPTHVLAVALDQAGLTFDDVLVLNVAGNTRHALVSGGIDAYIGAIPGGDAGNKFRYLIKNTEITSNPSVYFARREFADKHPELLRIAAQSLHEAEIWAGDHPEKHAEFLKQDNGNQAIVHLDRGAFGLKPISPEFLAEQQKGADILHRFGFIHRKINVAEAALPYRLEFKQPVAV